MKRVWHESLHVSRPPHRVCSAAFVQTEPRQCRRIQKRIWQHVFLFVVVFVHPKTYLATWLLVVVLLFVIAIGKFRFPKNFG